MARAAVASVRRSPDARRMSPSVATDRTVAYYTCHYLWAAKKAQSLARNLTSLAAPRLLASVLCQKSPQGSLCSRAQGSRIPPTPESPTSARPFVMPLLHARGPDASVTTNRTADTGFGLRMGMPD